MNKIDFDQALFNGYLKSSNISKFHYFESIDSTNTFLKNRPAIENWELAVAETQTSGRGRRGRSWKDEPYQNLLFSLSYKLLKQSDHFSLIPLVSALSVAETCQSYIENVEVKWPNDVLVNGKKISGILVESKINGSESVFIIGVGLNINQAEFEREITNFSTSFYNEKKEQFNRERILAEIIDRLVFNLKRLETNDIDSFLSDYSILCSTLNKKIIFEYQNETKTGFALSIQKDGALLINSDNFLTSYHGNEIFHIR